MFRCSFFLDFICFSRSKIVGNINCLTGYLRIEMQTVNHLFIRPRPPLKLSNNAWSALNVLVIQLKLCTLIVLSGLFIIPNKLLDSSKQIAVLFCTSWRIPVISKQFQLYVKFSPNSEFPQKASKLTGMTPSDISNAVNSINLNNSSDIPIVSRHSCDVPVNICSPIPIRSAQW